MARLTKPKSEYKFDLKDLESKGILAHANWKELDNNKTRTDMFMAIKDLAYAILVVGNFRKYEVDPEKVSYEYAIYLFERIIIGSFKMIPKDKEINRFPLQNYVNKNLMHVIFTMKDSDTWQELVSDLEVLSDRQAGSPDSDHDKNPSHNAFARGQLAGKVLGILRVYYTYEEIRRLLSISVDYLYGNWYYYVSSDMPVDIRDFIIVLVSAAKRVVRQENIFYSTDVKTKDLKKAFSSAVRSTVFLSTVANYEFFPKELLLSLDIDSLYRLVGVMGGKTLRVPTSKELDTLLGGVVTVSRAITEGKDPAKAIKEAKEDYNLIFSSHINVQHFISKAMETFNVLREDSPSEPMINLLVTSINALDVVFKKLNKDLDSKDTESVLRQYCELSKSFSQLSDSLVKISSLGSASAVLPKEFVLTNREHINNHEVSL